MSEYFRRVLLTTVDFDIPNNQLQRKDTKPFQSLSQSRPGNLGPGAPRYKPKEQVKLWISSNQSCGVAVGSFLLVEPRCR